MRTDELDFDLPPRLVAQRPVEPRDAARLMVLIGDRPPEHRTIAELPTLLDPGDALVFNTSSVIPARLVARRESGRRLEGLALEPIDGAANGRWRVLLRASSRLRAGERILLLAPDAVDAEPAAGLMLIDRDDEAWRACFQVRHDGAWCDADGWSTLARVGWTPLPPYILTARRDGFGTRHDGSRTRRDAGATGVDGMPIDHDDRRWYQTVYADAARAGSVAAPTAGLHFTPALLDRLAARGVGRIDVALHVGEGTFRPVTSDTVEAHRMHAERYEVDVAALRALRAQRRAGGRIIAVGSTSARTLESLPDGALSEPGAEDGSASIVGQTRLLIVPPYRFRHLDGLLTNFHLPRSTLLAMVAALVGLDRVKAAYAEAIAHGYRFFSYGDAMLILPEPTNERAAPRRDAP